VKTIVSRSSPLSPRDQSCHQSERNFQYPLSERENVVSDCWRLWLVGHILVGTYTQLTPPHHRQKLMPPWCSSKPTPRATYCCIFIHSRLLLLLLSHHLDVQTTPIQHGEDTFPSLLLRPCCNSRHYYASSLRFFSYPSHNTYIIRLYSSNMRFQLSFFHPSFEDTW